MAGLHFFNPAPLMKLVEIVGGLETSPETLSNLQALAQHWGKHSVVCRSTPGFIVNRVARPFYGEALRALEEQIADPATLDAVLRDAGGFRHGTTATDRSDRQDVNYASPSRSITPSIRTAALLLRWYSRSWWLPGIWAARVAGVFTVMAANRSRRRQLLLRR
ncbi:Probable 3-hydroxybutyryl-CoA dehydrogenase [Serratia fonticola]|uniref:Probable 3-hydroxybutyryl-CoA dehydrogenase n=1 Tax=Serratia fonticola TaxID=47917 RepID=A0A4V6KYW1_SERFO|nr:Probable 3-hydroxybutyryl-CoA dehydrogenase [Serratia fonticola]